VQEKLAALERQLDAISLRLRTLGLGRAAEDLGKVSAELHKLRAISANTGASPDPGAIGRPIETPGPDR
jgi:hypothetical protein